MFDNAKRSSLLLKVFTERPKKFLNNRLAGFCSAEEKRRKKKNCDEFNKYFTILNEKASLFESTDTSSLARVLKVRTRSLPRREDESKLDRLNRHFMFT